MSRCSKKYKILNVNSDNVQIMCIFYPGYLILWLRNVLKRSVKWLTKWSSWTRMARDYFEEVLRANYKKFIKNNWFFVFHTERISSISSIKNSSRASSSATFFEHIPSRAKTERNFFRAFRARAGKFSSEPSEFSSERCSYPTLSVMVSLTTILSHCCSASNTAIIYKYD